jgi:glycosyltransferase involved in cell wall biosynthesis
VGNSKRDLHLKPIPAYRPLVSILIPAYNAQEWISDTIRSAIGQTWEPKEIIVIDDGSGDNTLSIARQFEAGGVRVVTQRNRGASAARNRGFSLSKGEYIQWLDADDILAVDKISSQIETLGAAPDKRVLLSAAFGTFSYRCHKAKFIPTALWSDLAPLEWLLRKMEQNVYMQTATWLVSRELTEAAGPWDTGLLGDDDGEYFCRVLLASSGVRFVPDAKVFYRTPWYSSLGYVGQSPAKIRAQWRSIKLHIAYLRRMHDTPRVRGACIRYLQTCLIYFYPEYQEIVHEAEQMAGELGAKLTPPNLSWKYALIQTLFGWRLAKRFQLILPRVRWTAAKRWDKAMLLLENRKTNEPIQTPARSANGARPTRLALSEKLATESDYERHATKRKGLES